jgi:predicted 3-demethylubiquinone-9 3-methyltransferase (glyoxalase superfamily)
MQKVTPFLWFQGNAEEAMNFYLSVFKDSKALSKSYYGKGSMMPEGTLMVAKFNLNGQDFMALNGGTHYKINPGISFVLDCHTQEEIDYYWDKLSAGGTDMQCGWLTDKFGVTWQIVPSILEELMAGKDQDKAQRVMQALMKMVKLDIEKLKNA